MSAHLSLTPPLLSYSSLYLFSFSHFYFSFHKSDHPSLRCTVTMATLHTAAGPHPLVLSLSSSSLPLSPFSPIICSGSTVLNIDGGGLHPGHALLSSSLLLLFVLLLSLFLLVASCLSSSPLYLCLLPTLQFSFCLFITCSPFLSSNSSVFHRHFCSSHLLSLILWQI